MESISTKIFEVKQRINKIKIQFAIQSFYLVIADCIVFLFFGFFSKNQYIINLHFIELFLLISSQYIFMKYLKKIQKNIDLIIKKFLIFYVFFISIVIIESPNPYSNCWLFVIPIMCCISFNFKKVLYITTVTSLSCFLFVFLKRRNNHFKVNAPYIGKLFFITHTIIIFTFCFLFFSFFLYYMQKIKKNDFFLLSLEKKQRFLLEEKLRKEESNEKYLFLFNKVEFYMQNSKPWLNNNYNLKQLAKDLNSNTSYISKAINLNTKNDFKTYINKYRLNFLGKNNNKSIYS